MAEEEPVIVPELEVDFHGRPVWCKMPSPEQILVWKRTLTKLQSADSGSWTGEEALVALERLRKIIDSMLVNKADIEWLDDEMLVGNISLKELAPLMVSTIERFGEAAQAGGNRETRRVKPAKKAARKAPAKKARA